MMKDKENVTIIIVTHNNTKTIKRALESVTKGIRPANQIIVGDNGSTDDTYNLLCNLLNAKPIIIDDKTSLPPQFDGEFNGISVRIFRKQLTTISHTSNIAMQMKWQDVTVFGFMEPTSWYAPDKIAQSIEIFDKYKSVACVVSDYDDYHSDSRVERIFCYSFDMQKLLAEFLYDRNFLVRSQIFSKLKCGFDESISVRDDYDLLLRISKVGLIYHIPSPLHSNTVIEINEITRQSIRQFENTIRQTILHHMKNT